MKGVKCMKNWVKPELYVENFELSQHVAAGCGEIIIIRPTEPGGSVSVESGCMVGGKFATGEGHWHFEGVVTDTNRNGVIDWNEFTAAAKTAQNGVVTGGGHANHTPAIRVGGTIVDVENKPFNS